SLLAISMIAAPAFAQNNAQPEASRPACGQHDKCMKDKKCFDPFVDINLTAEQKAQLDKIDRPCAIAGARKSRSEDGRKAYMEQRRKYLDQVKTVLTPEQYTLFLENIALKCHGPQARAKMDKQHKPDASGQHRNRDKHQR
ncbi:MAG: hypothetical protein K2M76_07240, partial [Muribaculaceae bacterium]|nr:hypothetical protein [Muribaculaceae bacterium]